MSDVCKSAPEVYNAELKGPVSERRAFWNAKAQQQDPSAVYPPPAPDDLVGLGLSGGGIRSAMFNLGLLQAFERTGLMKHVDYIASVSGGGYTNGYYSTLQNSQEIRAQKKSADPVAARQLSSRDTRFLLDGQYLNKPVEFITTYLLRTSITLLASISFLLVSACIVSLYFRVFDYPSVRVWLELLDLNSDLRVGLFSCAIAAATLLAVRWIVLTIFAIRGTPFHPIPGQWALIILAAFLLGIAIMIGNGDFAISTGMGWLPKSLDLSKSNLQLPVLIAVILLFSPMLRISSLLNSERMNASRWQKAGLHLVMFGTTWGAVFATVAWIGQEDVSGFSKRPPKFLAHDIRDYGALANLIVDDKEFNWALHGSGDFDWKIDNGNMSQDLKLASQSIKSLVDKSLAANYALRMENQEWSSWTDFSNKTLARWVDTVTARITFNNKGDVYTHVNCQYEAIEKTIPLLHYIENRINPIVTDSKVLETLPGEHRKAYLEANGRLLKLAALQICRAPKHLSKIDGQKLPFYERSAGVLGDSRSYAEASAVQSYHDAASAIDAWIDSGGKLIRIDGKQYKDLRAFSGLMEMSWSGHGRRNPENLSDLEIWRLNRMFLEIAYPSIFKERAMVSTAVVVFEDQKFRLLILFWASVCFFICLLLLDLNWVCAWFHFYRKRVSQTFLVSGANGLPLADLKPYEMGYPYPLFVAGMLLPQAPAYSRDSVSDIVHGNPTKLDGSYASNWYSFLFSPLYCGWLPCGGKSTLATYKKTEDYTSPCIEVGDAVVLSGAAVTPFMSDNWSMRLLMHIFNFRLEQWMPNPAHKTPHNRRFSLINLASEFLLARTWRMGSTEAPSSWRYGVIADGGFREFLGVEELIARRCKVLIISDAGCNNGLFEFGVLAELIRKLRLDHQIEVLDLDHDRPLEIRRLRRAAELDGKSAQHFVLGRIKYPEKIDEVASNPDGTDSPNNEALLIYLQMSLTGDEDIDIEQFRKTNPNFPDEPIANQFYSREQVESFRQLGDHIGMLLCRDISRFDCPKLETDGVKPQLDEKRIQQWRITKLKDAFQSCYRSECRQESAIAHDDARIGWILDVERIDPLTLQAVHRFESRVDHSHQLLIRDFVWHTLDNHQDGFSERFSAIRPADLFGISVECNRRYAGFRPEWPTSYFQVCGRDLLLKAAQVAEDILPKEMDVDSFAAWYSDQESNPSTTILIRSMSRLAVMLPRGVFRKKGSQTAAETLACLMSYIIHVRLNKPDESIEWIRSQTSQRLLYEAIRTGKAVEVERTLCNLIRDKGQNPLKQQHAEAMK